MAGIGQKVSPKEVMPFLARNIFLLGYESKGSKIQPTEYLILLRRYVQQARELAALAGTDGVIHVEHSLKRAGETRAPYILATTGRALMLCSQYRRAHAPKVAGEIKEQSPNT